MQWLLDILKTNEINLVTASIRLFLSIFLGGLIGIERETHKQLAGFRTNILICVGSTMIMMLSIYIPQVFQMGDPGRIVAQVVTGVGFLGAGAIMRIGANVRGITTAATIWAVAAVGMVVGAGMYLIAILSTGIIIFTLIVLDKFEKRIFDEHFFKTLTLNFKSCITEVEPFVDLVKDKKIKILTTEVHHSFDKKSTKLLIFLDVTGHIDTRELSEKYRQNKNVTSMCIENTH
ncbi:MAG: MgtC/SapB family protein [Spirochaetales bacterium]|nr:MgtC/SapB family protein [Spirochaetales bacterium]